MKMISALCTILVLSIIPTKSFADRPLEGCVDSTTITALLSEIRERNWQGISFERLRSIWPAELTDIECDSNVSRSVMSQDRIIKGHCQCCVTFAFKVQQRPDAARTERLHEVIINYSARRRDEVVTIARKFANAAGLRQVELKTVGLGSQQSFQWETTKGNERTLHILEVRFTHEARLWELFFSVGNYVVEPSSVRRTIKKILETNLDQWHSLPA